MFDGVGGAPQSVALTLLHRCVRDPRLAPHAASDRVTDMLNLAEEPFLVLSDVTSDEFGSRGDQLRAEYAQVNLASVLFAVVDDAGRRRPRSCAPRRSPRRRCISIPPFKVTGNIHLMPEREPARAP